MKPQVTVRDLLAIPFLLIALACEYIAVKIGRIWTAQLVIDEHIIKEKILNHE